MKVIERVAYLSEGCEKWHEEETYNDGKAGAVYTFYDVRKTPKSRRSYITRNNGRSYMSAAEALSAVEYELRKLKDRA